MIAAEDTRRLHGLLGRLGITTSARVVSYFDGNEAARVGDAAGGAARRASASWSSRDAGMPTVSDPGYRVVAAAVEAGLPVTVVPGPSAVLTALALSGLPTDRFCFEGFLPRKARRAAPPAGGAGRRAAHDGVLRGAAPAGRLPRRRRGGARRRPAAAAVCRELTKTYEEIAARHARRAGRVGGGRGARRDHRRGRGAPRVGALAWRTRWPLVAERGRRRRAVLRRRSPRWPRRSGLPARRSTQAALAAPEGAPQLMTATTRAARRLPEPLPRADHGRPHPPGSSTARVQRAGVADALALARVGGRDPPRRGRLRRRSPRARRSRSPSSTPQVVAARRASTPTTPPGSATGCRAELDELAALVGSSRPRPRRGGDRPRLLPHPRRRGPGACSGQSFAAHIAWAQRARPGAGDPRPGRPRRHPRRARRRGRARARADALLLRRRRLRPALPRPRRLAVVPRHGHVQGQRGAARGAATSPRSTGCWSRPTRPT